VPKLYFNLARLFKFGSLLSMAILGAGLVWFFFKPDELVYLQHSSLKQFVLNLIPYSAVTALNLGIVVLMFLPVVSVLICWRHFTVSGEKKYSRIGLALILVLIIGIFLGMIQVK
jgi:uncharacterized membrane protein